MDVLFCKQFELGETQSVIERFTTHEFPRRGIEDRGILVSRVSKDRRELREAIVYGLTNMQAVV